MHTECPKRFAKQKKVNSHNYGDSFFQGLIGMASDGVATCSSKIYPGSASDKTTVEHCGPLDHLVAGDIGMSDESFVK